MAERPIGRAEILLDGAPLAPELLRVLVRTVVDAQRGLPAMVTLHFRDSSRSLLRRARIRFGSRVEIRAPELAGAPTTMLVAEVTAVEQDSDSRGTSVVLRGYDVSHRLSRGRRSRTFTDVTDADIVRQVAQEAGLDVGRIDDDGVVHEHVDQPNLSDWDLLRGRARDSGRVLDCADGKLNWLRCTDPADAPTDPVAEMFAPPGPQRLVLGRDLLRFRPKVTAGQQVGEVQVRGWDFRSKQVVHATAVPHPASAAVAVGSAQLAATFGAAPHVSVDRPVQSQQDADAVAAGLAADIAGAQAGAHGTAVGNPRLRPGSAVRIDGAGWPHDGQYVISAARHIWDDAGYVTDFAVTGGHDRSLFALTDAGSGSGPERTGGFGGLVIAQVTDIDDPDQLFRVKVCFPWLAADYQTAWCRVAAPGAGPGRGLVALPEVGDEVLVGFGHGDISEPFVLGSLFNGVDTPPLADQLVDPAVGRARTRALVSRCGHRVVLQDDDARPQVLIATGGDQLSLTLDGGRTAVVLDSAGTVTIHAATGLTIASDADLTLSAAGSLTLQGGGGVTIDGGAQVSVTGDLINLG